MSDKPILIKAGSWKVMLNGHPPKVDCRVVAEDYYQKLEKENAELKRLVKGAYFEGFEDRSHGRGTANLNWIDSDAKCSLEGGQG